MSPAMELGLGTGEECLRRGDEAVTRSAGGADGSERAE